MKLQVIHRTIYAYSKPVSLCHNVAHLSARATAQQTPLHRELEVQPSPRSFATFTDFFGNAAHFFSVEESHQQLSVTAAQTVEVTPHSTVDPGVSPPWEEARTSSSKSLEVHPFTLASTYIKPFAEIAAYALVSFRPGRRMLDAALELTRRIHEEFEYDPNATTISTPVQEVLERRRGVCQDFAHLEISCLRSLGLAARYVSGYLRTLPPPGEPRLVGADATHAWVSVYCPSLGWVDLDPTNNLIPSEGHVLLAHGRDFDDVTPIKGVILGGGEHSVAVSVDVCPVP